jgi:hypothetical protein
MGAFDAATSITLAALPPPTNAQGLSFLNRKQAWTMLAPSALAQTEIQFCGFVGQNAWILFFRARRPSGSANINKT